MNLEESVQDYYKKLDVPMMDTCYILIDDNKQIFTLDSMLAVFLFVLDAESFLIEVLPAVCIENKYSISIVKLSECQKIINELNIDIQDKVMKLSETYLLTNDVELIGSQLDEIRKTINIKNVKGQGTGGPIS